MESVVNSSRLFGHRRWNDNFGARRDQTQLNGRHRLNNMLFHECAASMALYNLHGPRDGERVGCGMENRKRKVLKNFIVFEPIDHQTTFFRFVTGNMPGMALEIVVTGKPIRN